MGSKEVYSDSEGINVQMKKCVWKTVATRWSKNKSYREKLCRQDISNIGMTQPSNGDSVSDLENAHYVASLATSLNVYLYGPN